MGEGWDTGEVTSGSIAVTEGRGLEGLARGQCLDR